MFNISSKADYGVIALIALAQQSDTEYVSLTNIAERKGLSASYLTQIIQPLVKRGLVESKEGKGGGYKLLARPGDITLLEIIETLEGATSIVKCQNPAGKPCPVADRCEAKDVWPAVIADVRGVLRGKTLADFV